MAGNRGTDRADRPLPGQSRAHRAKSSSQDPDRARIPAVDGQSADAAAVEHRHQPIGLAILETRGRVSGRPRRTPVGNGRTGDTFWIIAEHGAQAGYVRNIQRDPRVQVRLRIGWRFRWVPGIAEILPDDDALARQRRLIRWHPLRAFNAMNVRVLGTDLLTVRVQLLPGADCRSRAALRGDVSRQCA
ncbi:MAG: nitroreductase/quinone reductase family protein [Pseudonocardiaceae bacterium]